MNTIMNDLGARIQELRKQNDLSIVDLAQKIGVSKSQLIRYESKGALPPADILNNLAELFGTSIDYLMNGTADQKAQESLKTTNLLQRFKEIEAMPEREQNVIVEVITAFVRDFKAKQAYLI